MSWKRILSFYIGFSLVFCQTAFSVDKKITDLTEDTAPTTDDLMVTVNSPASNATNKKVTLGNLFTSLGVTELNELSDVGSSTITAGRILIADGTKFQSIPMSGSCTLASDGAITCSGIGTTGVTAGFYTSPSITVDSYGRIVAASTGSLTGLSDIGSSTVTAGRLLVADGTKFQSVAVSGDVTITSAGAVSIGSDKIWPSQIVSSGATAGFYTSPSITIDADGRITTAATGSLTGLTDVGSATITAGRLLIADGTKFQSVPMSGSCTISSAGAISCAGTSTTGVTPGFYTSPSITVDSYGRIISAAIGSLTGLSDIGGATITAGRLLVADGTKFQSVAMSGDTSITSAGAVTLSNSGVSGGFYTSPSITVDTKGRIVAAASGSLTGLSDVGGTTITAGRILVADGTKFQSVAVSGSCSLASSGAITCSGIGETGVVVGFYTSPSITIDSYGRIVAAATGSLTGLSDVGSATITAGRLLVADGTKFQSVAMSGDATLASSGATTLSNSGVSTGFYTSPGITIDAKGRIVAAATGSLTGLNDVGSSTITAGRLLVADGTKFQSVAMSGDTTVTSAGVVSIGASKVTSSQILDSGVSAGFYTSPSITVDADGRIIAAATGSLTGLSDILGATITAGRLLIADGTKFNSVAMSGDTTVTSAGVVTLSNSGATAWFYTSPSITIDSKGRIVAAATGSLTGLSDVGSATITAGRLLIADGTKLQSVAMGGDTTITSAGVVAIGSNKVTSAMIVDSGVSAGFYTSPSLTVDADGRIVSSATGSLTGLSDIGSATITAGRILIADGTKFQSVSMGGNFAITSAGSVTGTRTIGASIHSPAASTSYVGPRFKNTSTVSTCECLQVGGTSAALTLKQCNGSQSSCGPVTGATSCTGITTEMTVLGAGTLTGGNDLQYVTGAFSGTPTDLRWSCKNTE